MHVWVSLLASVIPIALAQDVVVHPLSLHTPIQDIIARANTHGDVELQGPGKTMQLRYTARDPLDVFIIPLLRDGSFDPLDAMYTSLPAGINVTKDICIALFQHWTPWTSTYRIHFLSSGNTAPEFHDVTFVEGSLFETVLIGMSQLKSPDPYTPSSYHRLRGERIFSFPLSLLLGGSVVLFAWFIVQKKGERYAVLLLLSALLLTQVASSSRLLHRSLIHTMQYYGNGTFSSAGSLHAIAAHLQQYAAPHETVHLCTSGTSYAEKLFQYAVYPLELTEHDPHYIVSHAPLNFSQEGTTLTCNERVFQAEKKQEFADGSILFHAIP